MSGGVDWDSKVVIGQKAKAAKVTRNTSDLNGTPLLCVYVVSPPLTKRTVQLYVLDTPRRVVWHLTDWHHARLL